MYYFDKIIHQILNKKRRSILKTVNQKSPRSDEKLYIRKKQGNSTGGHTHRRYKAPIQENVMKIDLCCCEWMLD